MSNIIKVKYGDTELFSANYPYNALDIKYKDNIISTIYPEETVGLNTKEKLFDGDFDIAGYTLNTDGTRCRENIFVSNELPYEELEYIESTGTLYIDTGIAETNDIAIDCHFYNVNPTKNYLYGARQASAMLYNGLYYNNALEYNWVTINYTASNDIVMTQLVSGTSIAITLNGVTTTTTTGTAGGYNIFIFGNNNATIRYYSALRLYYFIMVLGGIQVRNFIPVRRKSDNVVCLYDTISNTFFTNQGTGEFIAGPVVLYSRLEYIESSGTLYIDTRILYNSTNSYEITQDIQKVNSGLVSAGSGWNAGGAVYTIVGNNWGNGSTSTTISGTTRVLATILIDSGSSSNTVNTFKVVSTGETQTLTRSHSSLSTYAGSTPYPLFSSTDSGGIIPYVPINAKMYNASIKVNSKLMVDLIPVKRSGSNEYGLLDKISHIFYRNAGTGSFIPGPPVTTEFILLLYIQSTGTLWVDTNYVFSSSLPIDIEFRADTDDSTGVNLPIAGCGDSSWKGPVTFNFCDNAMEFGTNGYTSAGSYSSGTFYRYNAHIESNNQSFSLNDTVFLNATSTYITSTTSLGLFTHKISTGHTQFFKGKLSYFRLSIAGKLVRNFIPVRRNADAVICLYDTITNLYFENVGTGEFIGGPEV